MEVVYRSRLENVYADDEQVSPEWILMLLKQLGQQNDDGWKLKVEDDIEFAAKYPETVLEYLQFWGKQVSGFGSLLERYRSD